MLFSQYNPDYFIATILERKHLLKQDKYKDKIIPSLAFLVKENRIKVYGFALNSNHIYVMAGTARIYAQRCTTAFMTNTAQLIIKDLRKLS